MNSLTTQHRLARLPREFLVRSFSALLLAVCVAFAVVLAVSAVRGESAPAQTAPPSLESLPPAA
jgi:ABC-type transporter Mla subunit MlaD